MNNPFIKDHYGKAHKKEPPERSLESSFTSDTTQQSLESYYDSIEEEKTINSIEEKKTIISIEEEKTNNSKSEDNLETDKNKQAEKNYNQNYVKKP
jgi:hypothetical protein